MLEETQMNNPFTTTKNKPASKRKMEPLAVYEEALNLVRNTLKIDEHDALLKAGYSMGAERHWRRDGKVPLVAINALRGLVVGHRLVVAETDGKKPLLMSNKELVQLADEVQNVHLKAKLYREVARRLSPET